ncbi:MAG: transporter suffix domain-containing protein [Bacteroidetes bacterium]|nr:transporter suffix domain-containing protein [Bacteroidota bacterium]
MQKSKLLIIIAIILIVVSCILFGFIFAVPFLTLTAAQKGIIVTILVISMEITWWAGVALIGNQLLTKYRKYLNPCAWWKKRLH